MHNTMTENNILILVKNSIVGKKQNYIGLRTFIDTNYDLS